MNKILIIIDAQNDFINGSLRSLNGVDAMEKLALYINEYKNEYEAIIFTADWHSSKHCSFKINGGIWPNHCIQFTTGAAIYPKFSKVISENTNVMVLTKGTDNDKEEYSVMQNESSCAKILNTIETKKINQIDICGIASEYCVLDTIKDLTEKYNLGEKINVLLSYVGYIKNNDTLITYSKEHNISLS